MNRIHSTAVVDPHAQLDGVEVGPFCVVGPKVKIHSGTKLVAHVVIDGDTEIGRDNQIFPFASIGMAPQDLKFKGEESRVRIGDRNHIRESCTIHKGTGTGLMETRIGSDCLLMAYSHVAHDCLLHDRVILANSASLAGHVEVGAFAYLGGLSGVHQFCKVGTRAFLSAGTMVALDVPPYCTADGRRAGLVGVNAEGLKRAGFDPDRVMAVKRAYKEFYLPGRTRAEALAFIEDMNNPDVKVFSDFVRASKRGVLRPRREHDEHE